MCKNMDPSKINIHFCAFILHLSAHISYYQQGNAADFCSTCTLQSHAGLFHMDLFPPLILCNDLFPHTLPLNNILSVRNEWILI